MTSTEAPDYTANVAAGVAFLNAEQPGWRERVSVSRLQLSIASRCILAQVCGTDFWTALTRLGFGKEFAAEHGFYVFDDNDPWTEEAEEAASARWEALQNAWVTELTGSDR